MLVDYNLPCCQAILDVILDAKYALIVRLHTLELFALPSLCPPSNDVRNIILNPVSSYQWPWRIDNVSMTTRLQLSKISDTYDSVGILVRYGSLFPWVSRRGIKKECFIHIYSRSQSIFCISMSFMQTSSTQVPALSAK